MRTRTAHTPLPATRPIPLPLIRDLVAVSLLTEDHGPSARSRLERTLGIDLTGRLLADGTASIRRAA